MVLLRVTHRSPTFPTEHKPRPYEPFCPNHPLDDMPQGCQVPYCWLSWRTPCNLTHHWTCRQSERRRQDKRACQLRHPEVPPGMTLSTCAHHGRVLVQALTTGRSQRPPYGLGMCVLSGGPCRTPLSSALCLRWERASRGVEERHACDHW